MPQPCELYILRFMPFGNIKWLHGQWGADYSFFRFIKEIIPEGFYTFSPFNRRDWHRILKSFSIPLRAFFNMFIVSQITRMSKETPEYEKWYKKKSNMD